MIKEMTIRGVATFDKVQGATLTDLRAVNFFYGSNGVGKTSISRLIADPQAHATCSVSWLNGNKLDCLVYNRDFIAANFDGDIRGIFTLGKTDIALEAKLQEEIAAGEACRQRISLLKLSLSGEDGAQGKGGELRRHELKFVERCWEAKTKYDDVFKKAFEPNRGSKERFRERVMNEVASNTGKSSTLEDLKERAHTLFGQDPAHIPRPTIPDASELLELMRDPHISKPIIGKGDVDVAALIQRLGISDWVKRGVDHYDPADRICPFCQEKAPASLIERLNQFFDESYIRETARIKKIREDFESLCRTLVTAFLSIESAAYPQLDKPSFDAAFRELKSKLDLNSERLEHKAREPSIRCEIEAIDGPLDTLFDVVRALDDKIQDHNRLVDGYKTESARLITDIWRFMLDIELKDQIDLYKEDSDRLKAEIAGIETSIQEEIQRAAAHEKNAQEIQRSTNSIQPTIDAMNALLRSFGFTSFSIGSAGNGKYKLVRADGSDAKGSLSEGERTFVTFLYFYHLLKGSHDDGGGSSHVVVVIDDPVSSLDSDVLFIVSTLVRSVMDDAKAGTQRVKQVFVLTHNVYFHKEVTYDRTRRADRLKAYESFWIVRKPGGVSQVERQDKNPVQTSYQLLWSEVRGTSPNNINIQNTLRRILENYFKILGGIDIGKLPDKFDGPEKLVCKSLTSWLHDGSHTVHDDVCVALNDSEVAAYLKVFEKIFESQGQHGHYRMMMGIPDPDLDPLIADERAAEVEVVG